MRKLLTLILFVSVVTPVYWSSAQSFEKEFKSYGDVLSVSSSAISVSWPQSFSNTNYFLYIRAWTEDPINGKIVQIQNGIYDFTKRDNGFDLTLKNPQGYLSYYAVDTVSFDLANYWSKSEITPADTARWGSSGGGSIISVNGQTGIIVLNADDIDDSSTFNKFTNQTDIDRLLNTSGFNTGDQDTTSIPGLQQFVENHSKAIIPESSDIFCDTIVQASHGFSVGDWVGYSSSSSSFIKPVASNAVTADVIGVVKKIIDANTFSYQYGGVYTEGSWTVGANYFLSTSTPGSGVTSQAYGHGDVRLFLGTGVNNGFLIEIALGDVIDTTTFFNPSSNTADDIEPGTSNLYNQTHTGEVTGAIELTIADSVIDALNLKVTNSPNIGDKLTYDSSGSFTWKEDLVPEEDLTQNVLNGNQTSSFVHDAAVASIGNYNLLGGPDGTISYSVSIHNLQSGMMGTLFLDINGMGSININIAAYTDAGVTPIDNSNIIHFGSLSLSSGKMTSVTYTCASDGTNLELILVYGQER